MTTLLGKNIRTKDCQTNTADSGKNRDLMQRSKTFWELIDHFLKVIHAETGCPVVIYDTEGYIVKATDTSRIGDLHAGAEQIMKSGAPDNHLPDPAYPIIPLSSTVNQDIRFQVRSVLPAPPIYSSTFA